MGAVVVRGSRERDIVHGRAEERTLLLCRLAAQKSDVGMDKRFSGILKSMADPKRLAEGGVAHRVRRLRYGILSEIDAVDAIPYLH